MADIINDDPKWSLERQASSDTLVWKKNSPHSKVRFRFDVEVLEFEKSPYEDMQSNERCSLHNFTSSILVYATCIAALAASVFLPWYLMGYGSGNT